MKVPQNYMKVFILSSQSLASSSLPNVKKNVWDLYFSPCFSLVFIDSFVDCLYNWVIVCIKILLV